MSYDLKSTFPMQRGTKAAFTKAGGECGLSLEENGNVEKKPQCSILLAGETCRQAAH